jgi:hypothetical protein
MQLNTIEMPIEEAKERLETYRKALRETRNDQDQRIAAGYRALARGQSIFHLAESIDHGGFFDNGLPKIAVARADSQDCWVEHEGRNDYVYLSENPRRWSQDRNRGALVNQVSVRVALPNAPDWQRGHQRCGHTIMPIIPPNLRPNPRRLHHFHILWEVEKWDFVPPRDPALVKWIGGDLWAVVAAWDLTDLERAVLAR